MAVIKPTLAYQYTLYTNGATLYKSSTERSETSVQVSSTSNNGATDVYGDKFCDPTDYPVSDHNSSNGWMSYGYHFVYDGYTFSHWNTAVDGSGTSYYIGDTPQSNGVYYAIWEEIQYGYQDQPCSIMTMLPFNVYGESVENMVSLITFTIDSTIYEAEDGMTWGDWVESEYNTGGFYLMSYSICYGSMNGGGNIYYDNGRTPVGSLDNIEENHTYHRIGWGAGL